MNIMLYGVRATSLSPKLFAVVEEGVSEGGSEGRKREPIGNGKGRRNKEGAVFLVSLDVEGEIGVVDDPRDVIYAPRVIKRE